MNELHIASILIRVSPAQQQATLDHLREQYPELLLRTVDDGRLVAVLESFHEREADVLVKAITGLSGVRKVSLYHDTPVL